MRFAFLALWLSGLVPIWIAFRSNGKTTLSHAVVWSAGAWLMWAMAFVATEDGSDGFEPWRYLALSLSGCAGVAVLGARRPHVAAWDFVVLGLFAVMTLPLVERLLVGNRSLDVLRIIFLVGTLGVACLNYLPTRFGLAASMATMSVATQVALTLRPDWFAASFETLSLAAFVLLSVVPWIGLKLSRRRKEMAPFDQVWLDFRDRYGFVWGQRVQEQFNRSADHAGWPVRLRWRGLEMAEGASVERQDMVRTLNALLKRFQVDAAVRSMP